MRPIFYSIVVSMCRSTRYVCCSAVFTELFSSVKQTPPQSESSPCSWKVELAGKGNEHKRVFVDLAVAEHELNLYTRLTIGIVIVYTDIIKVACLKTDYQMSTFVQIVKMALLLWSFFHSHWVQTPYPTPRPVTNTRTHTHTQSCLLCWTWLEKKKKDPFSAPVLPKAFYV